MEILKTDILIIGSGIAGLSLALKLRDLGEITILTKKRVFDTTTILAQGGIACVMDEEDSFDLHIRDTLLAGNGLCDPEIVELVVKSAPERIRDLIEWGVEFDRDPANFSKFHLTLEGGHSRKRILHVGDYTGRIIENKLIERVLENSNIQISENHLAVKLIPEKEVGLSGPPKRVVGAYVLDLTHIKERVFLSKVVILCTGGAGKVYIYTSNPDTATGDGIALAYEIGCKIANLEFIQFHPTCLYHPKAKNFLISETLRGEGAVLLNAEGKPFMHKYDPIRKELAPRDVVTRAIDMELKKTGAECVYLDISKLPSDYLRKRFPYIYETCLKYGIDITNQPIPVVPAAHYLCGGILTNKWGQTNISNLFAIGECACTGLHGANRLASNSLLEALCFSHQASLKIKEMWPILKESLYQIPPLKEFQIKEVAEEKVFISHNWDWVRKLMWDFAGIVRNLKMLELAKKRIDFIKRELETYWSGFYLDLDVMELKNICTVAELILISAMRRLESRGTHYLTDYPYKREEFQKMTVISKF
ncbi:MAG: L-aspartate oxidase [Thermodesulfobacteriaceae bacterium]|nr:L-aspartate oxidase [Thermodesulfobacteriaceae bacterium]MCX8041930.1 L-aspartate oxidase [Thermodesulfobacteriaceae bacterium]MDW8136358.1 L-aspartate oxidase [Thermodesulfobacterium sp.]